MNETPFETVGLTIEQIDLITDIYNNLKARFTADFDEDHPLNFTGFELFKHYMDYQISVAIKIAKPNTSHVAFTQVKYTSQSGKYNMEGAEYQTWVSTTLKKDFGHILIRKETLFDRITELIYHSEIEFNDKKFDNLFYVVASDKEKATNAVTSSFRNALIDSNIPDITVEIIGNQMIMGNQKPANVETTVQLATLVNRLASLR